MSAATFDIVLTACLILAGLVIAAFLVFILVALVRVTAQTARGEHDKSAGRSIFTSKGKKE